MSNQNNRTQEQRMNERSNNTHELRRQLEKIERETAMVCSHSRANKKGEMRFTLQPLHNGLHRCEQCDTTFSLNPVDHKELMNATDVVHNAIQQVRAFADPFSDETFIRELGRADYNVQNLNKYYTRALQSFSNKQGKGKKHKSQNSFGGPF